MIERKVSQGIISTYFSKLEGENPSGRISKVSRVKLICPGLVGA